jgi:hypothetical protein
MQPNPLLHPLYVAIQECNQAQVACHEHRSGCRAVRPRKVGGEVIMWIGTNRMHHHALEDPSLCEQPHSCHPVCIQALCKQPHTASQLLCRQSHTASWSLCRPAGSRVSAHCHSRCKQPHSRGTHLSGSHLQTATHLPAVTLQTATHCQPGTLRSATSASRSPCKLPHTRPHIARRSRELPVNRPTAQQPSHTCHLPPFHP